MEIAAGDDQRSNAAMIAARQRLPGRAKAVNCRWPGALRAVLSGGSPCSEELRTRVRLPGTVLPP